MEGTNLEYDNILEVDKYNSQGPVFCQTYLLPSVQSTTLLYVVWTFLNKENFALCLAWNEVNRRKQHNLFIDIT